jgi:hypothetical protein
VFLKEDLTPVVFVKVPAGHMVQTPGLIIAVPAGQPKLYIICYIM